MDNLTVLEGFKKEKEKEERANLVFAFKEMLILKKEMVESGMTNAEANEMISMWLASAIAAGQLSNK